MVYLSVQRIIMLSDRKRFDDLFTTIIIILINLLEFCVERCNMTTKVSMVKLSTFSPCVNDSDTSTPTVPLDLSHILTGLKFPHNALSALYGHNNGSSVASTAIDMAEDQGFSCRSFDLFITNKNWTIQTIGLDAGANSPALAEMNVLTLNRCRKDLRHIVFDCWADFIDQQTCTPEELAVLKAEDPIFATTRPDFISFLHSQPQFKHLDAITYRVNTGTEIISVASVFSRDCIDSENIKIGFGPMADTALIPQF